MSGVTPYFPQVIQNETATVIGTTFSLIARIRFTDPSAFIRLGLRVIGADNLNQGEFDIYGAQVVAMNNDPQTFNIICKRSLNNSLRMNGDIDSKSLVAFYSTIDATQSVIDIYLRAGVVGNGKLYFTPIMTEYKVDAVTIQYYNNITADTEANITGGAGWDAESVQEVGFMQKLHKLADEQLNNSNTAQDDDDLNYFLIDPASYYEINLKWQFTAPGGPNGMVWKYALTQAWQQYKSYDRRGNSAGGNVSMNIPATDPSLLSQTIGAAYTDGSVHVKTWFQSHASLYATLKWQWAQWFSHASFVTVMKGATMEVIKLG